MTKHDPAEVEAVMHAVSECPFNGTNKLSLHLPRRQAESAITALDAHRAPAIRAAVEEFAGAIGAHQFHEGTDELRGWVRFRRQILAICGINEQENA